jgi:autotransporter passenger strand-loop-strand repeat protein
MATLIISSGQTSSGSIVRHNDTEIVVAGGSAVDTTVMSGGTFVFAGGSVNGLVISNGGRETVTSRAQVRNLAVAADVQASVTDGGVAIGGSVKSEAVLIVSAPGPSTGQGGTVSAVVVSGGGVLDDFGAAQNTTVLSCAVVSVGGAINGATVSNGGTVNVASAGYAGGVTVMRGGALNVSGGTIAGIRVANGGSLALSNASVLDATVFGNLQIAGNVDNVAGLGIGNGGTATIVSGGQVSSESITSSGRLFVASGGLTFGTLVDGGNVILSSGGEAAGVTIESGGQLTFRGGDVDGITVGAGARQTIGSSAIVSYTTYVDNGGQVVLLSGGHLDAVTVDKGGTIIFDGGTVVAPAANPGANEVVASGAIMTGKTIGEGVRLFVRSGGTATNITLDGAAEFVASGGVAGGTTNFGSSAKLVIESKAPSLTVSKFNSSDVLDFTAFKFGRSETLSFAENARKTEGVLTLTDGPLKARITLFGNYMATGFDLSVDSIGGTALTTVHSSSSESHSNLAFSHQ